MNSKKKKSPEKSKHLLLRFGIPTLDRLLGRPQWSSSPLTCEEMGWGIGLESQDPDNEGKVKQDAISLCLIGADGVGKSILAMHLASRYRADVDKKLATDNKAAKNRKKNNPLVIYASTDLTFGRAEVSWRNFALDYPDSRIDDPFAIPDVLERYALPAGESRQVRLRPCKPLDDLLDNSDNQDSVQFIDLATHTTGDDWAYVNRLVGSLQPRDQADPKHLLVVDAIEGLEVLVGEIDAYGQRRDRRSRVAQLIRTAADKCHLVFLVEAAETGKKLPEEFVADAVVRIWSRNVDDYVERVVQVEKVRAQSQVPGAHSIVMRAGSGSTTGRVLNADDPTVLLPTYRVIDAPFPFMRHSLPSGKRRTQSYAYVFHSLNLINRTVMTAQGNRIETRDFPLAGFGAENIDNMLNKRRQEDGDALGLMTSDPAALIGEDGTYKGKLSKAFLAHGMRHRESDEAKHAVVLITTKTLESEGLRDRLHEHLGGKKKDLDQHLIFCRRLEVHMQSAESLFHVIKRTIRRAQAALYLDLDAKGRPGDPDGWLDQEEDRRKQGWRIRLVIDNWTTIRDMYPHVRDSPLFLPCLLFFLRREGIATVIVGNEDQGFSDGFVLRSNRRLRDLTAVQIYTWRVPFFGESRVAITVTPPLHSHGRGSVIRELRVLPDNKERDSKGKRVPVRPRHGKESNSYRVAVNRLLELYQGLEVGNPSYVPLRVHLFASSPATQRYFDGIRHLFNEITNGTADPTEVLREENPEYYDRLREFVELQGLARYPYTLVLQVDEYWSRSQSLQLHDQSEYLQAVTSEVAYEYDVVKKTFNRTFSHDYITDDPFRLFQPSEEDQKRKIQELEQTSRSKRIPPQTFTRESFFETRGYSLKKLLDSSRRTQKIPYAWDFGFLMINRCCWKEVENSTSVDLPWASLPTIDRARQASPSWYQFAKSCVAVAKSRNEVGSTDVNYVPFAVAPELQETISCLFLEIWCSEIDANPSRSNEKLAAYDNAGNSKTINDIFPDSRDNQSAWSLAQAIECFEDEAASAILIMSALLPPNVFTVDNIALPQNDKNNIPVAVRSWFSAAEATQTPTRVDDIYIPAKLPGSRSVRGDWFLATARGSRSHQMGERAIDLLCSRRGNIVRLQYGVGLPVRDCNNDSQDELWTPLWRYRDTKIRDRKVMLDDLLELGQTHQRSSTISWLWRSRFLQYDRHARLLRRWICSNLRTAHSTLGGEEPLDAYQAKGQRFKVVGEQVRGLVASLGRATVAHQEADDLAE